MISPPCVATTASSDLRLQVVIAPKAPPAKVRAAIPHEVRLCAPAEGIAAGDRSAILVTQLDD
jgi:hypothetical protein